jgi:hypothetical protein
MGARIDEVVLKSFRADAESLRDLDAVVRERCREIDAELSPEYELTRRDAFRITTTDIEDVLRERNGTDTAVMSLTLTAKAGTAFSFLLALEQQARLSATGQDRGKTILFVTDVRSLIRDRFRGGGRTWRGVPLRRLLPLVLALFSLVAYPVAGDWVYRHRDAKWERQTAHAKAITDARSDARLRQDRAEAESRSATAQNLIGSGSSEQKLDFLVSRSVRTRAQLDDEFSQSDPYPSLPQQPWYFNGPAFSILVPVAVWLLSLGFFRVVLPSTNSLFLIGDEIQRQAWRERWRERVIWGVGAAFVVSVLAGLVVSVLNR